MKGRFSVPLPLVLFSWSGEHREGFNDAFNGADFVVDEV